MHIADWESIKSGKITDVYFQRSLEILKAQNVRKQATLEVKAGSLPDGYGYGVLAGVDEALQLLEGMKVDVDCMTEGTIFYADEPVMTISGVYSDFAVYETPILGFLCQASGIATKASRCKAAAGDRILLSFGARRMHPALALMIDRSAYIGGCDGVSVVESAKWLKLPPSGTMPHALILIVGDTVETMKLFDKIIDDKVPRVALIDTFMDEKFEAIRVAEAMSERLFAIRLDTPSSRRGNFKALIDEVRWELNLRGFKKVKIIASGGLDEKAILELNPVVDAYGVGTAISNAPVLDFSMDIVEVDGKPIAKRGKRSAVKQTLRCKNCYASRVILKRRKAKGEGRNENEVNEIKCVECGAEMVELIQPAMKDGKILKPFPEPKEIREYVLKQLKEMKEGGKIVNA
jgi:nicotinate phosphoribosyltransferase